MYMQILAAVVLPLLGQRGLRSLCERAGDRETAIGSGLQEEDGLTDGFGKHLGSPRHNHVPQIHFCATDNSVPGNLMTPFPNNLENLVRLCYNRIFHRSHSSHTTQTQMQSLSYNTKLNRPAL